MRKAGTSEKEVRDKKGAYININNKDVGTAMSMNQTSAVLNVAVSGDDSDDDGKTAIADFDRLKNMVSNSYAYNNIKEGDRARIATLDDNEIIERINNKRAAKDLAPLSSGAVSRLQRQVRDIMTRARTSQSEVIKPDWV